jgi:altronate hydrolase
MPLHIVKLPTAANAALRLNAADNIAVARVPLEAGAVLDFGDRRVTVQEHIPAGHKVAIAPIEAGGMVWRYGQFIGRARAAIEPGRHVHSHNLAYEETARDYEFPESERPIPAPPVDAPTFLGYPREDGRVGTRNYIAVAAASNCSAHTVELIARSYEGETFPPNVDGVVGFPHGDGCGHAMDTDTADMAQLRRTIAGVLNHPNVAAAVIVGLGCEDNQIDYYTRSGRVVGLTLQSSGGTPGTLQAARDEIARLIERAADQRRVEVPASKIVLGLNCGGSDSFSGITANPALGVCSDMLAAAGGSVVLAETPECFGAEHLLVRRARNRQVAEKMLGFIRGYREYLARFGATFDGNPTPGNKAGGITNILEKSLGAAAKAGTSTLNEAVGYAERIDCPGFVFMNTPGYDPPSLAGLAAGGVNLIAFTTGRGSAIGFPTIPVIKIASNSHTFSRMRENMEVNAGAVADGERTLEEVGREIFELVLRVASGQRTRSEFFGHREFVPWRIGPVV